MKIQNAQLCGDMVRVDSVGCCVKKVDRDDSESWTEQNDVGEGSIEDKKVL